MNCKAGDLAIIVNCLHPENLGAIVEVLSLATAAPDIALPHWHVKSVGRPLHFTYTKQLDEGYAYDVFMFDKDLRPIRPDQIVGDVLASNPMILPRIERETALTEENKSP